MDRVKLALGGPHLADSLARARADLMSITRARNIEFVALEDSPLKSGMDNKISISIQE